MQPKHWTVLLLLFISACKKELTTAGSATIIIGGFRQEQRGNQPASVAKYWKNGLSTNVTDGSKWVFINDMNVYGNDIYLAGHERPIAGGKHVAKYWKNGNDVALTDGTTSVDATAIAVAGTDVYVAGHDGNTNYYFWKNGILQAFDKRIIAFAVAGNDVYTLGTQRSGLAYWKDESHIIYLEDPQSNAYPTGIAVSGTDVYVGGSLGYPNPGTAAYWKNGKLTAIGPGFVNAVAASGTDIYLAGYLEQGGCNGNNCRVACYWKSGNPVRLSDGAEAVDIAVDKNSDVHVIGRSKQGEPLYWKNGNADKISGAGSEDSFVRIAVN